MKTKAVLTGILIALLCAGCTRSRVNGSGDFQIRFYVDPETRVEYVMYVNGAAGGICPRYNPDGSLYIKEK